MILSWSTNSKMWGASMRIPTVPMVVTRKKSHSWARSTTMATYFQSSRIWNRAGWTLLIQKKLSNHFKFFKMYQHLHSHRAWMWKACNLQGQCAQWKGGIPTELALSISSDLMWHFDWSWKVRSSLNPFLLREFIWIYVQICCDFHIKSVEEGTKLLT